MSEKKSRPQDVAAGPWKERRRPASRPFPGPRGSDVALRVAISRAAFGEVTRHAHESLEREVCGVLAGELCEDDEGPFVEVLAAVRGNAAREARGHVTFTHETWNSIHETLEREHPRLKIVGWYHTHPGFGVEFSDMDLFIQQNFFPLPQQVALVMDPLGGAIGLATNGPSGVRTLDRFWVEGREHRAQAAAASGTSTAGAVQAGSGDLAALETRVSQLVTAVHDLRQALNRFLLATAVGVALAVVLVVGYALRRIWVTSLEPPRNVAFVPVPVTIEGKPVLLGVGIASWSIPDELLLGTAPLVAPPPAASPSPPTDAGSSAPPAGSEVKR